MEQISNIDKMDKVMFFVEELKLATQVKVNYNILSTLKEAITIAIRYDTAQFRPTRAPIYNYAHILYRSQVHYQNNPIYHYQTQHRPKDNGGLRPIELN